MKTEIKRVEQYIEYSAGGREGIDNGVRALTMMRGSDTLKCK